MIVRPVTPMNVRQLKGKSSDKMKFMAER